jgi:hypothetical protein
MKRGWAGLAAGALLAGTAAAQPMTADADRTDMMRQLGLTALVPGANGDPAAPDHANTDEAKANPYPNLPDPLRFRDGRPVRTPADWARRRQEIADDYANLVYGREPAQVPPVQWAVTATDREMVGFTHPVLARSLIGTVENAADPTRPMRLRMTVVLPADAKGPVPVLVMFGRPTFPAPSQPTAEDYDRINAAARAALVAQDPSLALVLQAHPALTFASPRAFTLPERDIHGDPPPTDQLIAAGWGYATLDPTSAQADDGAGLRSGIIGLVNRGGPRRPDDWGALRAWAWAAGRAYDWLVTQPAVDAHRIGIEGVSRYGKAALLTMTTDPRFAIGLIGSSGKGGATPLRRNFGEGVANLATGEYYWMAGNFLRYDTKGVSKPNLDANDLPVDANELIALAAPRPLFISYGVPAAGDAEWLDQRGSWMATVDASRVYRLLGRQGVPPGDYPTTPMPPVETGPIGGALAWRQHAGGHTDAPNMKYFLTWAAAQLGSSH